MRFFAHGRFVSNFAHLQEMRNIAQGPVGLRIHKIPPAEAPRRSCWWDSCGQGRDRTGDLPLFRRTLVPTELPGLKRQAGLTEVNPARCLATPTGLEPATSAVTGRRANQLRYGASILLELRTAYSIEYLTAILRTPNGIRTRVTAVKGRRPRPLDDGGRS